MKPKEIFWSGLKGGIFEQKHYVAMGDAIFLFGWLTTRQTQVNDAGEGMSQYGNPVTDKQIATDTGFTVRNIRLWRKRLTRTGYIHTVRASNLGLIYFVHKAKHKAKNPKPSTRYFPAELQPNGNHKVSHFNVTPESKVLHQSVTTLTPKCHTYADKSLVSETLAQITNTLIPKHLSNYNTQASVSSLIGEAAKAKAVTRAPSQASLDAKRRELLQQGEEMKRTYPRNDQPGQVIALKEAG